MNQQRSREEKRIPEWKIMLWALLVCLLGSIATFTILLRVQEGFGADDFPAILVCTVFFSISVALSAIIAIPLSIHLPLSIKLLLIALCGVLVAMFGVWITAVVLGPWIGAFSIPLLPGWLVGAVSGLLAAGLYFHTESTIYAVSLSLVVVVLLVIGVVMFDGAFLREEPVTIITVLWEPDSGPTRIRDDPPVVLLTAEERSNLASLDLSGTFTVNGKSTSGGLNGARRVILVMHEQIDVPVELPLPKQNSVIYIQVNGNWLMVPPDIPTATASFRLIPSTTQNGTEITTLRLEVAGGESGTTVFAWR